MANLWEQALGNYVSPFNAPARQTEEKEDEAWNNLMGYNNSFSSGILSDALEDVRRATEEMNRVAPKRTWFDRMIAPFEAPQQFLFSATKNIAEDGFQFSDLTDAAVHAAKFFNPWSEQERIGAEEITDIFFGEGTSQDGWGGMLATLGISLLYDPLLFSGAAKALGAGSRAVRNIERFANPASLVMEGAAAGGRAVGKGATAVTQRVLGPERYAEVSGALKHLLLPPSKAHPEGYLEYLTRQRLDVQEYQIRLGGVIKTAESASPGTSEILLDAFINRELNMAIRAGDKGDRASKKLARDFWGELSAKGVDHEIAYKMFEDWTEIATDLEGMLLRHGVLNPTAQREMAFRHLRHSYTELQNPTDALRRVNLMLDKAAKGDAEYAALTKSKGVFGEVELRQVIEKFADDIMDIRPGKGEALARQFQKARIPSTAMSRRYIKQARKRGGVKTRAFDADAFADDLHTYMVRNPEASIADTLSHIKNDMLNIDGLPEEAVLRLTNFLSKGVDEGGAVMRTMTLGDIQKALTVGKPASEMSFQTYSVAMKKLQERKAIPQKIMDEVFGFQHSAIPRMVEHITDVAQEASLGKMLDELAGAERISTAHYRWAKKRIAAAANETGGTEKTWRAYTNLDGTYGFNKKYEEIAEELGKRMGIDTDFALRILDDIDSGDLKELGVYFKGTGGGLATEAPTAINTRLLSDNEAAWGALAGMYVPETVYRTLRHAVKAAEEIGTMTAPGVGHKLLDIMEGVTGFFKFMKIAGDAGAHARDLVGSLIQMSTFGLIKFNRSAIRDAAQLVKNVKYGKIDDYLQLAHDVGFDLLGGSFSAAELTRRGAKVSKDSSRVLKLDDWLDNVTDMFETVADLSGDARNWASGVYQSREHHLRAYSFISRYEEIVDGVKKAGGAVTRDVQLNAARQAAATVEAALFNYSDVSVIAEFARRYGVAPFITFPTKAAGQVVDLLYNSPHQVLKYHRGMHEWNSHWAGGDEAFAKEIQALPDHVRRNLVVRLPWETEEGNPLYLDLSYFIPWSSVRDLMQDIGNMADPIAGLRDGPTVEGEGPESELFRGSYPGASGGGIFSPVIVELLRPFVTGKDGLGRDIHGDSDTTWEKARNLGRELYQFMVPPTFPIGGSTADSVGRAIMAAASEENEPRNWVEYLGLAMRMGKDDDVLNRYGEGPTSRALPKAAGSNVGKALTGVASMFLPITESDPERAARNQALAFRSLRNEVAGQIRTISSNPNLSERQKEIRINRLLRKLDEQAQEDIRWGNFIGQ